jgi:CheY-like chemotaxis protein
MGNDQPNPAVGASRKILVADDNEDIREMLALFLRMQGHEVFVAADGEEAVLVAEREEPDLIFMDVMMPRLSGVEAAREIHGLEWMKGVPIVAISAFRDPLGENTSSETFRWHAFLRKPIDPEELERLVANLFKSARPSNGA